MPSPQKTKGRGFENEVAKQLSELFGENFMRVMGSGAFLGGKNHDRRLTMSEGQIQNHRGDIVPPDGWKHFNAEAKFYQDFPFHQLLTGSTKILDGWIEQTLTTSCEGDLNIIFMKFNRKGQYVAFQSSDGFFTTRHCLYNGLWYFTTWDDFFADARNLDIMKTKSLGKSNKQ